MTLHHSSCVCQRKNLDRLHILLRPWQSKKSCTRKKLESLLGHLSHAATVIQPGRIFLRHLFSLLSLANKPHHFIRLNLAARADLQWWTCFLQRWNGTSLFSRQTPSIHVYSDASGTFGCWAFDSQQGWFQLRWPPSWNSTEITAKELVPIVVAAALWGNTWSGQHVCFHVDNMAVVYTLLNRAARDLLLTHLLRCLSFYSAYYRFDYSAVHIPGKLNSAADVISRNHLHLFSSLVPQVQHATVPPEIQDLLVHRTPDWGSTEWTALFGLSLTVAFPLQ